MTARREQLASVLTRAMQQLLARGLSDPRVRGLITVTRVRVSDDLSEATVFVSVTPEDQEQLTMHGLRHAAGHLRSRLGDVVDLRRVPKIAFQIDRSLKKSAEVYAALRSEMPSPDDERSRSAGEAATDHSPDESSMNLKDQPT